MTSGETLSTILAEVADGRRNEGDFFEALLNETLYALIPRSDDHPRLRLLMFQRPDGQMFIPLFTDEEKAELCAQGAFRVIHSSGRDLLEVTSGALVMINPNDEGCTLYPEECRTLLTTGALGSFGHEVQTAPRDVLAGPPRDPPIWLLDFLKRLYATLPFVEEAYAVDVRSPETPDTSVLTIVIVATGRDSERAARATLAETHEECSRRQFAFSIAVNESREATSQLAQRGVLFYSRGAV